MTTYDQWKTRSPEDDLDYYRDFYGEEDEEEPSEEEYAFLAWCDEMLEREDADRVEPGTWFHAHACVALVGPSGGIDFWTTCVLPSTADVAVWQWLKF